MRVRDVFFFMERFVSSEPHSIASELVERFQDRLDFVVSSWMIQCFGVRRVDRCQDMPGGGHKSTKHVKPPYARLIVYRVLDVGVESLMLFLQGCCNVSF